MGKKRRHEPSPEQTPPFAAPPPTDATPAEPAQTAELEMRMGRHVAMRLRVRLTPAGIAAIGGLVSGILLSTAVVVRAARRDDHRISLPRA